MQRVIGMRRGEQALCLGQLFNPQEGLKLKLVDKVVPEDKVLTSAQKEIKKWLQIPSNVPFVLHYRYLHTYCKGILLSQIVFCCAPAS